MRVALGLMLASSCLLAGCQRESTAAPPAAAERKLAEGAAKGWNVLLLSVDTLRADRLGAYGYRARANSPRIDALLASGVRFERAESQRALTWPSLASILSGLYPSSHGVMDNGYRFPDDVATLPKLLKAAGYTTGAFLSNMCQANHQAWDAFACSGGEDGKTVGRATEWAQGLDQAKPFFLWVHLFGAHPPYYNGGDRAARELDPGYSGPLGPKKWQLNRVMAEPIALDRRDLVHLGAIYDAAVMGTDHLVGALLDGLRAAGRLDRTLIIFTADHGEELYQHHQYLFHACSVYQTGLHVPLGFVATGLIPGGPSVPQPVELIDLAPTLLALVGVGAPAELQGVSLLPYLARPGEGGAGKPAFSEYGGTRIHTVLTGDWKLIDNPDGIHPACIAEAPGRLYPIERTELYDLASDPGETTNLAAGEPARVRQLQELIRQRFAGLKRRAGKQEISPEMRKKLKALGYIAD